MVYSKYYKKIRFQQPWDAECKVDYVLVSNDAKRKFQFDVLDNNTTFSAFINDNTVNMYQDDLATLKSSIPKLMRSVLIYRDDFEDYNFIGFVDKKDNIIQFIVKHDHRIYIDIPYQDREVSLHGIINIDEAIRLMQMQSNPFNPELYKSLSLSTLKWSAIDYRINRQPNY